MQINVVSCENDEEYYEIIKLLQEKYKDNPNCKFREISETFILPDKKWIITNKNLVEKSISNIQEVISRGANTLIISNQILPNSNFNYVINMFFIVYFI